MGEDSLIAAARETQKMMTSSTEWLLVSSRDYQVLFSRDHFMVWCEPHEDMDLSLEKQP